MLVADWQFGAELVRLATTVTCEAGVASEVKAIAASACRPVTVAVHGRRGVGRATVERALRRRGVQVTSGAADVPVVVVAEACKPEDRVLCAEVGAAVAVVTKADLLGGQGQAPLTSADAVAVDVAAATGVPAVAVVGLLAAVDVIDDADMEALRALIGSPADLSSVDAFGSSGRSAGALLERLDRFGIAHAVLALSDGADATAVVHRLWKVSRIDALVVAIDAAAAPVRYRRMTHAINELSCLAMSSTAVADFLTGDRAVLARMAAAVDVVESIGARVDRGGSEAAHRERALVWQRHRCGPASAVYRACATDIVRGSLRLLNEAR